MKKIILPLIGILLYIIGVIGSILSVLKNGFFKITGDIFMLVISMIIYSAIIFITLSVVLKIKNNKPIKKLTFIIIMFVLPTLMIISYISSIFITLPKYLVMSNLELLNTYLRLIFTPALLTAIGSVLVLIGGVRGVSRNFK